MHVSPIVAPYLCSHALSLCMQDDCGICCMAIGEVKTGRPEYSFFTMDEQVVTDRLASQVRRNAAVLCAVSFIFFSWALYNIVYKSLPDLGVVSFSLSFCAGLIGLYASTKKVDPARPAYHAKVSILLIG